MPLTKKLVQQDHVFAVYGSLGTAPIARDPRLPEQGQKVPQVLVATGDSYWGAQGKQYPWTIGFQPDYPGESQIYGKFIATKVPQAKIGVLMQDDAYGQNYYNGLVEGLGDAKSKIVDVEKYDATQTDVSQQIVKLKAAGANVVVLFSLPTQTIDALVVITKIGWKPVDVHQQRVGLAALHGPRAEERREHRRRHLRDVPATTSSTTRTRPRRSSTSRSSPSTTRERTRSTPTTSTALPRVDVRHGAQVLRRATRRRAGPDERADEPATRRTRSSTRASTLFTTSTERYPIDSADPRARTRAGPGTRSGTSS